MEERYHPEQIERKWQARWRDARAFATDEDSNRPKFYCLEMFPYPSGYLHMGHVRNYSIGDAVAWYKRLTGYHVFHPIGWDSFGQPAEQAAIERGIQPHAWTEENIAHMRGQLQRLGISYDWQREIATHRPQYYRWNQWFFLQMYKRGLVYRRMSTVNWCPQDETVLSNEQSANGRCWRCKTEVVKKDLEQWFIRITDYADELLAGLQELRAGWPESVVKMQHNWIGRSQDDNGTVTYNLHDWCISRQRFWGTPIPIVYCQRCGTVPVPAEALPVQLPEQAVFTGAGASPLAAVGEFVNTRCPQCDGPARRETDTMDTFVDSSWYFFRYCDAGNSSVPFESAKAGYWIPVDFTTESQSLCVSVVQIFPGGLARFEIDQADTDMAGRDNPYDIEPHYYYGHGQAHIERILRLH